MHVLELMVGFFFFFMLQPYKLQTDMFRSVDFQFEGDTSLWKNSTASSNLVEFVTSPNNPDGKLNRAVLEGTYAKSIYDHAYYWPHFTPILAPSDEDLMIFTISKLTGHAGSRFGYQKIIHPCFIYS